MINASRLAAILILIPCGYGNSVFAQVARQPEKCQVQKIYVSRLGSSEDSTRFQHLLVASLEKKKFTVVDHPDEADAVLSGEITISPAKDKVTVDFKDGQLNAPSGERLWRGSFHNAYNNRRALLTEGNLSGAAAYIAAQVARSCRRK
jgi:hypothetical protein